MGHLRVAEGRVSTPTDLGSRVRIFPAVLEVLEAIVFGF